MIGRLRKLVGRTGGDDHWDADALLEPVAPQEYDVPYLESALPQPKAPLEHSSRPWTSSEYCRSFVKGAIEQGGRFEGYEIPIPWLRMILAGLEGRQIEAGEMWKGFETPETPDSSYRGIFPSRE